MHNSVVRRRVAATVFVGLVAAGTVRMGAWGPQGHRVVARVAENHLSATARQNVRWLLDNRRLADVATWADDYRDDNSQTGLWHYVDIARDATSYQRERDCPAQVGAKPAQVNRVRDCIVDRILYHQRRLADPLLDRSDRAIALKFLVHFVGDLHQPMHAMGDARGGNDVTVNVFGSATCGTGTNPPPCNLHGVWDSTLIARRQLNDAQYATALETRIKQARLTTRAGGTPADWANESHALARAAWLTPGAAVNEAYYQAQIVVIDDRLAIAGLRLATALNQSLAQPPP